LIKILPNAQLLTLVSKAGMVTLQDRMLDVILRKDAEQSAWEQIVVRIMCDLPSEDEYAGLMVVKTYDLCVTLDKDVPCHSPGIFHDIYDGLFERLPRGSGVSVTGGIMGPVYLDARVQIKRAPGKDPLPPFLHRGRESAAAAGGGGGSSGGAAGASSSSLSGLAKNMESVSGATAEVKAQSQKGMEAPGSSSYPEKKGAMHILLVAKTLHLAMGSSFSHAHALVL
jgi:hypothetical protein